MIYKKV